ncbi:hypothetical protein [Pseudomonas sp. EYE_354]|uniref:hypothetical protein n=1 Tax=Pseudomonas sp. EYE_354 TaxID=2853449 RepID=UPI002006901F|nr:hypothetical protein [Pseudomonas sp. EYE_354]MCK6190800.1 hypothetical protein [Pseudomonas sp. EYE_354]
MSAQSTPQRKIPSSYPATTGVVEGSVGEHTFKTSEINVIQDNGVVMVTAIHRDDDGSSEEIYIQFPDNVKLDEELRLEKFKKTVIVWVSFKGIKTPRVLPYEVGALVVQKFSSHPLQIKGYVVTGDTIVEKDHALNIKFDFSL